mmetsp:Transcript_43993/g.108363  ORF Transcript_43993/g.108363 Transcript_43993/m.108363 type:complete len:135 (+) Transcript_43993:43-447(+)
MPREASAQEGGWQGGRDGAQPVPPQSDQSTQPPPAPHAPSQPPAQPRGGGILGGIMPGLPMGPGAPAGPRAVDSVLGQKPLRSGDACDEEHSALRRCLKEKHPSQCEEDAEWLRQCQQGAPTVKGDTVPPTRLV